jgi:hypothetical protein
MAEGTMAMHFQKQSKKLFVLNSKDSCLNLFSPSDIIKA